MYVIELPSVYSSVMTLSFFNDSLNPTGPSVHTEPFGTIQYLSNSSEEDVGITQGFEFSQATKPRGWTPLHGYDRCASERSY